jgi:TolB-like protein
VLPFANLSGDPERDYFVDGVTENLTTDLSRVGGSFVIGRHTAFTYKNKAVDLKQVGRDLNVDYVLEGSVQRGANRLRVNAQLVDAETGSHLWADRFDKPVGDLFELQDEVTARIAKALDAQLIEAEARRAETLPESRCVGFIFPRSSFPESGTFIQIPCTCPSLLRADVGARSKEYRSASWHSNCRTIGRGKLHGR